MAGGQSEAEGLKLELSLTSRDAHGAYISITLPNVSISGT